MSPSDRDPVQLGGLLAEATAGVSFNREIVEQAAKAAFSSHDLFSAGPTSNSEAMLQRVLNALDDYAQAGRKVPAQVLAEKRTWEQRVRIGRERDRLHAEAQIAFPGCICMRFGGRYPKEGLVVITPDGRTLADPTVETYRDPCPCPIGDAARIRIAAARDQLLADDQARMRNRLWKGLKLPEIPPDQTLDSHPDQVKIGLCRRWYAGEFKPGLVIAGLNQRGKSITAFLLARQAIDDGLAVVAMTVPDLLGTLRSTFDHDKRLRADPEQPLQHSHQDLIDSLQQITLLVLDDMGAEKMSDYVETALYQILDGRVNGRRRTLITTNLPKTVMAERVGPRVWGRISHLCDRVVFEGPMIGPARGGLDDLEDITEIA